MHRPISIGIVEFGQGRRLTRARAHNLICVQKSYPWLGPLHEDAMLSPKRSDVVVYSHPSGIMVYPRYGRIRFCLCLVVALSHTLLFSTDPRKQASCSSNRKLHHDRRKIHQCSPSSPARIYANSGASKVFIEDSTRMSSKIAAKPRCEGQFRSVAPSAGPLGDSVTLFLITRHTAVPGAFTL